MNSVIEDYVKVIYSHTEWQQQPLTTSALAERLGLAASSVTEMVKKLVTNGLVTHVPYGAIELTDAGVVALPAVSRPDLYPRMWAEHIFFSTEAVRVHESVSDTTRNVFGTRQRGK